MTRNDLEDIVIVNTTSSKPYATIMAAADAYAANYNKSAINLISVDTAGVVGVQIAESVKPELTIQEQAMFVAGVQECIKWLSNNSCETAKVPKIRIVDYDGMGGREFEYHCGSCKILVELNADYCSRCGTKLEGIDKKDTWGL